ncbi:hypothetical protein R3P38DRAFT_2670762 [Favolaschia claudopus]|uniref:DUF6589 domain-containing protein n=1 Tax=Favolaschia claudopus TaxID=2862362 RepID=A0AAV9Z3B6_9AGAR
MATTPVIPGPHSYPALCWTVNPTYLPEIARLQAVIDILRSINLSPMDFITSVLVHRGKDNPLAPNIDGFYRGTGLEQLLNVVLYDKRGSRRLFSWFQPHSNARLIHDIHGEMDSLSEVFLQKTKDVTPEAMMEFNFEEDITEICRDLTPKLRFILRTAAQTKRAEKENTTKDIEPQLISMIQCQLAKARSQNNNLCAIPCSLYFLACPLPRKAIDTLNHAGICLAYKTSKGLHSALAVGNLRRAQTAARSGHALGFDNENVTLSEHVEQRPFAPPKVQSGTTSIIYLLRSLFDMATLRLLPILEQQRKAELITFNSDVRPTYSQMQSLRDDFRKSIVELLIHGNKNYDYVRTSPELQHTSYRPPPPGYKTQEFVLRTTTIDEATTEGTIQVCENIYLDQLQYDIHDLDDTAVPTYNDQKTNALIRSGQLQRRNDVSAILRLEHLQIAPGAFHMELNFSWMILRTHRGEGAEIGSLQYFIGLLAKTRLGSPKPDFETLVSLLMQVLTGAMHHYWEVEAGMSLDALARSKPSASRLLDIAARIYDKYASGVLDDSSSDYTFQNFHLLMRDTLVFYTLRGAISSGDFGRVELLLGTLTMMFTGGGCPHYKTELLYFLQNLNKVWPEPFANVMRDNALISTSGQGYVGVDKNAEFNINFQKNYFAAKGVHASWDMLADLSPNIPLLRRLKTQFGEFLGAPRQGTHHTKVDTSELIAKVKSKVQEHQLHLPFVRGRRVTERESVDVLGTGASMLRDTEMSSWGKAYKTWLKGV